MSGQHVQRFTGTDSQRRVPGGCVPAPHAPDAGAPAVCARPRAGGRAHPVRLRSGPAGAAAHAGRVSRHAGDLQPRGPVPRAGPDPGVPPRAPDRRAACPERRQGRGALRRRPGGHRAAAEVLCRGSAGGAGRHAARHPQLHLARHLQGAPHHRRYGVAGRPRRGGSGRGGSGVGARPPFGVLHQSLGAGARGQARSPHRPDGGAAAHARDPLPAPEEQPRVRRRRRRRQDRARGGAGGAAARGRRPRSPRRRRGLRPRHHGAPRRHAGPRRPPGGAPRSAPSTPRRSSPARGSAATSRSVSRRSSPPSQSGPCRSCSSTRCTPRSGPAPRQAARWTSPP